MTQINKQTTRVLHHLAQLVACDTQNPPRAIYPQDRIFTYINEVLGKGWHIEITDHGKGRISYFAQRGTPNVLFNVHLDTVPTGFGWTHDAHTMTIEGQKAYGRGVCDIKGAAAALLSLAEDTDTPMALLFSTDEESSGSCCIQRFCEAIPYEKFNLIVVAEPTEMKAVTGHRGYLSVEGKFKGQLGHTSHEGATNHSAVHQLTRWAAQALDMADDNGNGDLRGNRFNIGRIEGGISYNVVANQASVNWSMRPAHDMPSTPIITQLTAPAKAQADWQVDQDSPSLPAYGQSKKTAHLMMQNCGIPIGNDVDFWTEAALFSQARLPAVVLGPGNIAQAHTIDEWVSLTQLSLAYTRYNAIIKTYNT